MNIIFLTIDKSSSKYYGVRTPAVFLQGFGEAKHWVYSAMNGTVDQLMGSGPDLDLNTWYTFELSQQMIENEVH